MPNNIAVSITADVADFTAKRAILSAELKSLTAGNGGGLQTLASDAAVASKAMGGLHAGSAGVTRELIVMAREAARGNFSRLAGSATILAGRLNILTPTVAVTGAAIAALAAPLALFLLAAEQGSQELAKFRNAMEATNGYAGVTFSQLQEMAQGLANWAHEGVGAATSELMKLAASGHFTGDTIALIGADATRMAQLTGQSADQFNAEFEKMGDGVAKFAADYQAKYHQLTTAQFEYIQQLEQEGRSQEAAHQLALDLYNYLGTKAPEQLGTLEGAWHRLLKAADDYWAGVKEQGRIDDGVGTAQDKINVAQREIARIKAGAMDPALGGQGAMNAELAAAKQRLAAAEAAKAAEEKTAAAAAAVAQKNTEGVASAKALSEGYEASKTSGEKLRAKLAEINDEQAKATAANPGGAALFAKEAAAMRSQAEKSDAAPKGPKAHNDDVAVWEGQLQTQLEDEKNYFGDSKAEELKFWTEKLALTTQGSEQQRQVKTKIYELDKELAHQSYDAQIASFNEQLEANRDNWTATQALEAQKLAYIALIEGQKSAAYKEAQKTDEEAERTHQRAMADIARTQEQASLEKLKANLATDRSIREANAKTQEAQITDKGKSTPGGEIAAATQIMALHKRLTQQEMADDAAVYAQESALAQAAINAAVSADGTETQAHAAAVAAKKKLDDDYYNHKRQLENQSVQQQIQDYQRIQQSWHSYVDPMVSTTGAQIKGLITGTESWGTAIKSIGSEALTLVIQAIEKMVAQWIVAEITGQAAQSTTASTQIASYAGIAGAAGIASMAGAPFPLDLAAPAFGASMSSAALAFGSLGGFARGLDVVPDDMIAQIHKGERIMPAADNSQLMAALAGANQSGGGRNGTGDRGGKTLSDIHREILKQTSASMSTAASSRNLHSLGKRALKSFRK